MTTDLAAFAKERGVKYFLVSFTDLLGGQRAKVVPAQAIAKTTRDGAGFAGFATWLDLTPAHPDMLGLPDADGVIQLPWKPEMAWVPASCVMEDAPVAHAPRDVLVRLVEQAAAEGLRIKTGVEPEFTLMTPEGDRLADPHDTAVKPCYDQLAILRQMDMIGEAIDAMVGLGWGPYQTDHEDANGQFEMNWDFDDALATADKHSFFKFMIRALAERHGMRATFMPKPLERLTGNGAHVHVSAWDAGSGANLFLDEGAELGMSEIARHFLGGIMRHAPALTAITNPTVNSYKRLNAPRTTSGATWAPNTVTWSGNNRTHMVRVPGPGRFELRLPDGAANPYLLQAAIIAAGLAGVRSKADPGPRRDSDMYAEAQADRDAPRLPLNLLDALRALEADEALTAVLGEEVSRAFLKIKRQEWDSYAAHFSEWERRHTLDV